jgi:hypothetical protein
MVLVHELAAEDRREKFGGVDGIGTGLSTVAPNSLMAGY